MARAMRQGLKISNEEGDGFEGALSFAHLIQEAPPTVAMLKRFLAEPTSADARRLMLAVARIGIRYGQIQLLEEKLKALEQTDFRPQPLVNGDDLTAAGLQPGPLFKRVLDQVYDAQLEDRVKTRQEAMELAMTLARESPRK